MPDDIRSPGRQSAARATLAGPLTVKEMTTRATTPKGRNNTKEPI